MSPPAVRPAPSGAPLRAAPCYRAVPLRRLSPADQARFAPPGTPADALTVLFPDPGSWRRMHVIGPDTAGFLTRLDSGNGERPEPVALARLVLDGIVEIRIGQSWQSGPEAHPVFFTHPARESAERSAVLRLSRAALRYGAALPPLDPRRLAARLYRFNTRPASPAWRTRIAGSAAVNRLLGGIRAGTGQRRRSARAGNRGWLSWDGSSSPPATAVIFKLYLSPDPEMVAMACRVIVERIGKRNGPFSVKVGQDLPALLRPDKLVAYFRTEEQLRHTAEALGTSLAGMPAQGVPFTAPLDQAGLLSWGVDGGHQGPLFGPLGVDSWRGWITQRLAAALTTARESGSGTPADRFALDRVALDGVDTERWTPPGWLQAGGTPGADH